MRHRVLGALGAAGAAHDVLDLGKLAQHVLDAVVQAVDLVERGLGGQDRLEQERALVERGHEVAADREAETERGERDAASDRPARAPACRRHASSSGA